MGPEKNNTVKAHHGCGDDIWVCTLIYLYFWCVSAKWLNFTRILFALENKEQITDVGNLIVL